MPQEIMRLVWTSIHGGMSNRELRKLSPEVRSLSIRFHISGLVVVCDEDFFTIIEGSPLEIITVLTRAVVDQRHHSVNVLFAGTTNQRIFEGWKILELEELARTKTPLAVEVKIAEFNPRLVQQDQLECMIAALAVAAKELHI